MKNSRRSDRELAKALGVSQPTVSRTIQRLEQEKVIREFSVFADLSKLGYGIMAVLLGKRNYQKAPEDKTEKAKATTARHRNIIFASEGNGLGFDRVAISIHKNYSDYARFMGEIQDEWQGAMEVSSFLIDLNSKKMVQPLSMKDFADLMKEENGK